MVLFIINWTVTGGPTGSQIVDNQHSVDGHIGVYGRSLPSGKLASYQAESVVYEMEDDWVDFFENVFVEYDKGPPYKFKRGIVDECYKKASSKSNFAVQLVCKGYSNQDRTTSYCTGEHRYKKKQLSPERKLAVVNATFAIYPVRPGQTGGMGAFENCH